MEENLLYSESIDLNVNLIKNDNNGTPKKNKTKWRDVWQKLQMQSSDCTCNLFILSVLSHLSHV